MSTVGRKLLSSIIRQGDPSVMLQLKLFPDMFRGPELALFDFLSKHLIAHGVIPSAATVQEQLGDVLVEATEPPLFYADETITRFVHTRMKQLVLDMQALLQEQKAREALKAASDAVGAMFITTNRTALHDYRNAYDVIFPAYEKKLKELTSSVSTGIQFGWPYLDNMSAGAQPGDFITICGRPSAGKTFAVLNTGLHSWKYNHCTPLVVSLEMGALILQQRLASMDTHKSLKRILRASLSTGGFKSMMSSLSDNKGKEKPLWIMDTNLSSSVEDIVTVAQVVKPDIILVDGAYLLRHRNARLSRFERIADNAERLKYVAGDLNLPVVASYQLHKDVKKKKKGETVGLEDIYGSDAMGQLSTIALGFLEPDTVETIKRRHCTVLKGRNGEVGGFDIKWNFEQMDFGEVPVVEKEKMQFLG